MHRCRTSKPKALSEDAALKKEMGLILAESEQVIQNNPNKKNMLVVIDPDELFGDDDDYDGDYEVVFEDPDFQKSP